MALLRQNQESVRKTLTIRPYLGGLKMNQDTVTQDPHFCVLDSNWNFYNGEVIKRPGLTPINAAVLGSASTFVVGSFRFRLEDGTVHQIACTPTAVFEIGSGGSQTAITGTAFTGANTDLFSFAVANDELIVANGIDLIRRWNGVSATLTNISGSGAPSAARYVESFVDRIIAARTTESSVLQPTRVRWSGNASNTVWNNTSAGFTDLRHSYGWITGLKRLRGSIVVYKEDSLVVGTPTGIASSPISFDQRITAQGCVSGHTVANIDGNHIYLGRDNVYIFDLSSSIPVGDTIREELFNTSDFDRLQFSHGFVKDDRKEYWIWVVPTGGTTPRRAWCYNWVDRIWSRHNWTHDIISSSQYATDDIITIDDLVGTIDEQLWRFDDRTSLAFIPYIAVGSDDGFLYYLDTTVASDDGTSISAALETVDFDFGRPGFLNTVSSVRVLMRNVGATNIKIAYSTNEGATYTESTVTFTPGSNRHTMATANMIVTAERIRFRITNDQAAGAAFTGIILNYIERGPIYY